MLQGVTQCKKYFIGGDFNDHVRSCRVGFQSVHEALVIVRENSANDFILEFAVSYDLIVTSNTLFKKRPPHLVP